MDSKSEELIFQDELAQTLHKAVLGEPEWDPVMAGACRKAACDGLVLLKNEAVLPLDRNTGWMEKIEDRVVSRLGTGNDGPVTINLLLDGKTLTSYVIQSLRRQARGSGQPAWG